MTRPEHPFIHRLPVKDRAGKVVGEKEVVSYRGLLDMVHKDGLRRIRTRLLQAPSKENGETAIVRATVRTNRGTFSAIGDANPGNVNARIAPHIIRMAETRAEARAMRKAVNIGVVALEELGEDLADDVTYEGAVSPVANPPVARGRPDGDMTPARTSPRVRGPTPEQERYLFRLLGGLGMRGDKATEFLHRELAVTSLADADRTAVSTLIDRLKGNGHGDGQERPASPASLA